MGLENPLHILILLVVVLLVFGAKRLPELGHSLGSGLRGFKDALSAEDQQLSLSGPHAHAQLAGEHGVAAAPSLALAQPETLAGEPAGHR